MTLNFMVNLTYPAVRFDTDSVVKKIYLVMRYDTDSVVNITDLGVR